MANDLNRCEFIGRLGADPEVRYSSEGAAIANIRIACGWKSKDKEGAEWVPVVFFGKLAEIVGQHLHKGERIFVAGRFRTRKWQGDDGKDRYSTEIVAGEMQMLGGRAQRSDDDDVTPLKTPPPATGGADFNDDIPFE